ncbi:hypothetical protein A6V37_37860 [Paraburkholderia ginsengiterrae]|uniref:Uncharacterized protein n=1 Tax=Paraburkholderia ginsengiterrae TaxID=1462993 RepID=A0A1A9NDF4_9BURK|nr:hypothetical protein A6V37_37860 [Paraburkholderia ginsengiterrae]
MGGEWPGVAGSGDGRGGQGAGVRGAVVCQGDAEDVGGGQGEGVGARVGEGRGGRGRRGGDIGDGARQVVGRDEGQ